VYIRDELFLDMAAILSRHGTTSERLSIYDFKHACKYGIGCSNWTLPFLSIPEIEEIKRSTQELRMLVLDVHRSDRCWPAATLNALSEFPDLIDLTIDFNLEDL
jgi:hypothetical protein